MNYKKLFLTLILFISFFAIGTQVKAVSEVTGWGWSDGIGWISFNCSNTNSCATSNYKVTFATSSNIGTFSGYAWSDGAGWISFDEGDASSYPNITANMTTGAVSGYARAIAGIGRTDGWDGWISMSGVNYETGRQYTPPRGITFYEENNEGIFKGYAWGDTNVGWLSFTVAGPLGGEDVIIVDPPIGGPSCSFASYSVVGNDVTLNWDISNDTSTYTLRRNDGSVAEIVDTVNSNSAGYLDPDLDPDTYTYTLTSTGSTGNSCSSGSITVVSGPTPPVNQCTVPANAQLCNTSPNDASAGSTLVGTSVQCTSTITAPIACQFYCPTGFNKVGNICKRPGVIRER